MESRPDGKVRPSALAALRLMTNSNLADCTTGKSAGFSPFENSPSVNSHLAIGAGYTGAVAHQAARENKFALLVRRREPVTYGPQYDLFALGVEERIGGDEKSSDPLLRHRSERQIDLVFISGLQQEDRPTNFLRRGFHVSDDGLGRRIFRIDEMGDDRGLR